MTKREFLNAIVTGTASVKEGKTKDAPVTEFATLTIAEDGSASIAEELIEFAKAEIEKLDKENAKRKNSSKASSKASSKPSAKAQENLELAKEIVSTLRVGDTYTAKKVGEAAGISTPKATVVLKAAVEAGYATVDDIKVDGRTVKGYMIIGLDSDVEDLTEGSADGSDVE
jgi:hypothetical protein